MFIKPVILYGLETLIIRKVDIDKFSAVLNKARRMILKLNSKSELKVTELEKKGPIKSIRTQLAVQRANLWISINRLNDIE